MIYETTGFEHKSLGKVRNLFWNVKDSEQLQNFFVNHIIKRCSFFEHCAYPKSIFSNMLHGNRKRANRLIITSSWLLKHFWTTRRNLFSGWSFFSFYNKALSIILYSHTLSLDFFSSHSATRPAFDQRRYCRNRRWSSAVSSSWRLVSIFSIIYFESRIVLIRDFFIFSAESGHQVSSVLRAVLIRSYALPSVRKRFKLRAPGTIFMMYSFR